MQEDTGQQDSKLTDPDMDNSNTNFLVIRMLKFQLLVMLPGVV